MVIFILSSYQIIYDRRIVYLKNANMIFIEALEMQQENMVVNFIDFIIIWKILK